MGVGQDVVVARASVGDGGAAEREEVLVVAAVEHVGVAGVPVVGRGVAGEQAVAAAQAVDRVRAAVADQVVAVRGALDDVGLVRAERVLDVGVDIVALAVLAVVGHVVERDRLTALHGGVGTPRVIHLVFGARVAVVVVRLTRVDAREEPVVVGPAVEDARDGQDHVGPVGVVEGVLACSAVHGDRNVRRDDLEHVVLVAEVDLDAVDATRAVGGVTAHGVGPDRVAGRRIGVAVRIARDVDWRPAGQGRQLGNLPLRPALDPKVVDLAVRRVEMQHLRGPVVCDVGGRRACRGSERPKGERSDCTNEPSMASCLHRAKVGHVGSNRQQVAKNLQ